MTQKLWQDLSVIIKQHPYLTQLNKQFQKQRIRRLFLFYKTYNQQMIMGNKIEEYFNKIPNRQEDNLKIKYNKPEKASNISIITVTYLQMMKS